MNEAPELLPCPFCGGPAAIRSNEDVGNAWVSCDACLAQSGGFGDTTKPIHRLREFAAEEWNRRTPIAAGSGEALPDAVKQAAEFTRSDLGETGANYPHIRTMLGFIEALASQPKRVTLAADIAEFMRRLGPQWFLAQNWFPASQQEAGPREIALGEDEMPDRIWAGDFDAQGFGHCVAGMQGGLYAEYVRADIAALSPGRIGEETEDRQVDNLRKIADASRRADGSDIPLGEEVRRAADTIVALRSSLSRKTAGEAT